MKTPLVLIALLLIIIPGVSAQDLKFGYMPHAVQFKIIDTSTGDFGFSWYNPIPNVTIIATPITIKHSQFLEFFGIKQQDGISINSTSSTTNDQGIADLYLTKTVRYNLTIVTQEGTISKAIIYPDDDSYNIFISNAKKTKSE
jgi:hypothetical protein